MTYFPKFDLTKSATEKRFQPKAGNLDGLGGLDGKVVDFTKILANLNKDEYLEFEERAAIIEYDGGLPRPEAETKAIENIIYLREYRNGKR